MKAQESANLAEARWAKLRVLQGHYKEFSTFLEDAMEELGFGVTDQQFDIGQYIAYGPQYLMVQAQRSQAKTTIAACFAVWSLIHMPHYRVLIISAGGTQAVEISTLIVRLITTLDVLECLRPDKLAGDRMGLHDVDSHADGLRLVLLAGPPSAFRKKQAKFLRRTCNDCLDRYGHRSLTSPARW